MSGNCPVVPPDKSAIARFAFIELEGHGFVASKMASISSGKSDIRLLKIRHAPSFFASLRTRLGDQPICLAKASGDMASGRLMAHGSRVHAVSRAVGDGSHRKTSA